MVTRWSLSENVALKCGTPNFIGSESELKMGCSNSLIKQQKKDNWSLFTDFTSLSIAISPLESVISGY